MHFQFCRWLGDQLLGNPPPVGDQRLGDPPLPVGDPVPAQSQEARRTTMVISSDLHITGHNPSFIMEPNTLCSSSERNTSSALRWLSSHPATLKETAPNVVSLLLHLFPDTSAERASDHQ
ncbi:hypothetical protein Y1Q_0014574 [Alligator mississippiensis]|uniref:Uncharacterized protein n=1 Tax=Alligator mississippiensis TaxID=8496 RepID=A0A151PD57_ALLMI|nr:hypothetical protein Y1Q_0014574 [Alligator mississippiensis]